MANRDTENEIPYWAWLFKAVSQDVTVTGDFYDQFGQVIGAGMGDQEAVTSSADVGWRDIYGSSLFSALDFASIASVIAQFNGPVLARAGLNKNFTVRGAVAASSLKLEAGTYLFGRLARGGVERVDNGGDQTEFGTLSLAGSQVVSSTILRVLGATNWTLATANGGIDRVQTFWQNGAQDAFVNLVAVGGSLVGAVSSTLAIGKVPLNGVPLEVFVPAGYDTCIVKAAASAEAVCVKEWVR